MENLRRSVRRPLLSEVQKLTNASISLHHMVCLMISLQGVEIAQRATFVNQIKQMIGRQTTRRDIEGLLELMKNVPPPRLREIMQSCKRNIPGDMTFADRIKIYETAKTVPSDGWGAVVTSVFKGLETRQGEKPFATPNRKG